MLVFNHGHSLRNRPILRHPVLDSFCSAISSITLFTDRSNRRRRRKTERRGAHNNKTSTVIWGHWQLRQQWPSVSNFAWMTTSYNCKGHFCGNSNVSRKYHERSMIATHFLGRQTHCAAVGFFAKRRDDKEQKRMDLIKEKRNRERQTETDVFVRLCRRC